MLFCDLSWSFIDCATTGNFYILMPKYVWNRRAQLHCTLRIMRAHLISPVPPNNPPTNSQDLTKILQDLVRSCKILPRSLQDPHKILQRSCKIFPRSFQDLAKILQDLVRFLTRAVLNNIMFLRLHKKILLSGL